MADAITPLTLPCVPNFDPHGDTSSLGSRWEKWIRNFETYAIATGIQNDVQKRQLLLHCAGSGVQDVFETLVETGNTYQLAKDKLSAYFKPQENPSYKRHIFRLEKQKEGETVATYATRLRQLVQGCGFEPDHVNDFIRDQIIDCCASKRLRVKLLADKELTLDKTLEVARAMEASEEQAAQMSGGTVHRVHARSKYPPKPTKPKFPSPNKSPPSTNMKIEECKFCGRTHEASRSACPASGQTCSSCGGKGHFAKKCFKGKHNKFQKSKPPDKRYGKGRAHCVQEEEAPEDYAFKMSGGEDRRTATTEVMINGVKCRMEADSCSSVNILDEERFQKLQDRMTSKLRLQSATTPVFAYLQEKPLDLVGQFYATIESLKTGNETEAKFLVAKGASKSPPLLSLATCLELDVIQLTNATITAERPIEERLKEQYPEVFHGLGNHKRITAKLIVDTTISPVCLKQRKIPYNLVKKAEEEEQRLKKLGVIEDVPHNQPTTWCTNPVIAPKPNKPDAIRYCCDMRVPNTAIQRPVTEVMTTEDLRVKLNGATVFSVLDMNEGYHQLTLEEESRHMTTFYGTGNKMRYTRLNFGTISAQDIFDQAMDDTIEGLPGVCHIRDDFIVYGKNDADHDQCLEGLIKRFSEDGLTFNPKKCRFRVPKVEFFGSTFSKDGISPSPSRVEALQSMTAPQSATEVRSLLGMAQYSAQFIPNFAEMTTPLRKLTHQEAKWRWGRVEEEAFQKLRNALSSDKALGYYETGLPTKLTVDAGPNGLGLLLLQKKTEGWKPVACASRSLTAAETRYSQIEREALAIRWGCEKCYMYLIGSKFVVETDHLPLLSMFQPRSRPPLRIERWLLYLQQFDFELKHTPGAKNPADYLSRHSMPLTYIDVQESNARDKVVRSLVTDHVPRAMTAREVEVASVEDEELKEVRACIQSGKWDKSCSGYFHIRSELSTYGKLVLRGTRIIPPRSLRDRVMSLAHEGHPGVVSMKQRLRTKVWWPGLDRDAENYVRKCHGCQVVSAPSPPEPLKVTELPTVPWKDLAIDLLGPLPSGDYILVCVDYYSRFYEVDTMKTITSERVIKSLDRWFTTHGLPVTITSDNGKQFTSEVFEMYLQKNGIEHRKVTPLWPQANGEVERQNRSLMKRIRISQTEDQDWKRAVQVYLMAYRSTPHSTTGVSPAELLYGRKIRTKLPDIEVYRPDEEVRDHDQLQKVKGKLYADTKRRAQESELTPGDLVLLRQEKKNKLSTPFEHQPYEVVTKNGNSVVIESPAGVRYKRNITHVKKYHENVQQPGNNIEDIVEDDIPTTLDFEEPLEQSEIPCSVPTAPKTPTAPTPRPSRTRIQPKKYEDYDMST